MSSGLLQRAVLLLILYVGRAGGGLAVNPACRTAPRPALSIAGRRSCSSHHRQRVRKKPSSTFPCLELPPLNRAADAALRRCCLQAFAAGRSRRCGAIVACDGPEPDADLVSAWLGKTLTHMLDALAINTCAARACESSCVAAAALLSPPPRLPLSPAQFLLASLPRGCSPRTQRRLWPSLRVIIIS